MFSLTAQEVLFARWASFYSSYGVSAAFLCLQVLHIVPSRVAPTGDTATVVAGFQNESHRMPKLRVDRRVVEVFAASWGFLKVY